MHLEKKYRKKETAASLRPFILVPESGDCKLVPSQDGIHF
jgi:hypothetical protein